jgi:hypothetical protein
MTLQEKIDADVPLTDAEYEQFLDMMTFEGMDALFSDSSASSFKVYGEAEIRDVVDDLILNSSVIS